MIVGSVKNREKKMMRICKSCGEVTEILDIKVRCHEFVRGHFCVKCGIDPDMEFLAACREIKAEVFG